MIAKRGAAGGFGFNVKSGEWPSVPSHNCNIQQAQRDASSSGQGGKKTEAGGENQALTQYLESDTAPVLEMLGLVHLTHPAATEEAFDPIGSEFLTRCEGDVGHSTGLDMRGGRRRFEVLTDGTAVTHQAGRCRNRRRAQETAALVSCARSDSTSRRSASSPAQASTRNAARSATLRSSAA
jgi:hypothetical protein